MTERAPVAVIVPAAGSGVRLGREQPKAFVELDAGRTMLEAALANVAASGIATQIVVVVPADLVASTRRLVPSVTVVAGGAERSDSVRAGIAACAPDVDAILVHDAARPLTPPALFRDVLQAVRAGHEAVVPGIPVVDTLKEVGAGGAVMRTVDREPLRAIQTPQGFGRDALLRAHADDAGYATDDAGLAERHGIGVHVVPGSELAFKITTPLDLTVAQALLAAGAGGGADR